MAEFLSKATGTAVDWVQMIGMKVIYLDSINMQKYIYPLLNCISVTFISPSISNYPSNNFQPGPDSIGIVAVSRNTSGVAARACGLVSLEPTKVQIFFICPQYMYICLALKTLSHASVVYFLIVGRGNP